MQDEILFLKKQSINAYKLAKKAFSDSNYNWAIFLLEQAIQLLLKYFLALKIGYFSKTHRLTHLFEEVSIISQDFKEFYFKNKEKIKLIEDSYLLSRYLGKEYKKEDLVDKFEVYESLKKIVEEHESC